MDSLASGLATVHADVEAGGLVLFLEPIFHGIDGLKEVVLEGKGGVKPGGKVLLGDNEEMSLGDGKAVSKYKTTLKLFHNGVVKKARAVSAEDTF